MNTDRVLAFHDKQTSARWYTKDKLRCDVCGKRVKNITQIDNVLACFGECQKQTMNIIFQASDLEFVSMRMIEDVLFDTRQESVKRERAKFGLKTRFAILTRDRFKCVLCGAVAQDVKLEVDHIIPVSKGGKTEMDNLRTLCFECNRGKSDSHGED